MQYCRFLLKSYYLLYYLLINKFFAFLLINLMTLFVYGLFINTPSSPLSSFSLGLVCLLSGTPHSAQLAFTFLSPSSHLFLICHLRLTRLDGGLMRCLMRAKQKTKWKLYHSPYQSLMPCHLSIVAMDKYIPQLTKSM